MLSYFQKKLEQLLDSILAPLGQRILAFSWKGRVAVLLAGAAFVAGIWQRSALLERGRQVYTIGLAATAPVGQIPLPPGTRALARGVLMRLAQSLRPDLDRAGQPGAEAWSTAQAFLATQGVARFDSAALASFFATSSDSTCGCWREIPSAAYPRNVVASAWVAYAQSRLGIQATETQLSFLTQEQHPAGWWSVFSVEDRPEMASTYGTSWALLALAAQRQVTPAGPRSKSIESAIDRGAGWLLANRTSGAARWLDYPLYSQARPSLSLSGLALYTLHTVSPLAIESLDHQWLGALAFPPPIAEGVESSLYWMETRDGRHEDHFEQVVLPWMIAATVAAYPHGTLSERARAIRWLDVAVEQESVQKADTIREYWRRAELGIALQMLLQSAGEHFPTAS
jgi:hypothetical protein